MAARMIEDITSQKTCVEDSLAFSLSGLNGSGISSFFITIIFGFKSNLLYSKMQHACVNSFRQACRFILQGLSR